MGAEQLPQAIRLVKRCKTKVVEAVLEELTCLYGADGHPV